MHDFDKSVGNNVLEQISKRHGSNETSLAKVQRGGGGAVAMKRLQLGKVLMGWEKRGHNSSNISSKLVRLVRDEVAKLGQQRRHVGVALFMATKSRLHGIAQHTRGCTLIS